MTDYEAIQEALREKASMPVDCPICENNSWGFPEVRLGLLPLDLPFTDEPEGESSDEMDEVAGFWPITCLNCGFVRLFHVETLLGH